MLLQGDFGWSLVVSTTHHDVLRYLLDRQTKGFNAIYLGLIDHLFSYDPPRNWFEDEPFTTPGDFSTPNEAYFAYADWVIQKAAEARICVFVAPASSATECAARPTSAARTPGTTLAPRAGTRSPVKRCRGLP